jgi:hypothetical protein
MILELEMPAKSRAALASPKPWGRKAKAAKLDASPPFS